MNALALKLCSDAALRRTSFFSLVYASISFAERASTIRRWGPKMDLSSTGERCTYIEGHLQLAIARTAEQRLYSPNAQDTTRFWQNKGQLKLFFIISIMFMSEFLCGFDGTIVGGFQALDSWHEDLGNPGPARIGLLNAISSITGFLIGPLNAYVCDRWGRRWPLRAYGFTMCLGTVLGVLAGVKPGPSSGFGLFVASKAIIGAGMQAGLITAIICMQEITHPRNRPVVAGLFACNWVLGSTLSSFVTFGTSFLNNSWSWVSMKLSLFTAHGFVADVQCRGFLILSRWCPLYIYFLLLTSFPKRRDSCCPRDERTKRWHSWSR